MSSVNGGIHTVENKQTYIMESDHGHRFKLAGGCIWRFVRVDWLRLPMSKELLGDTRIHHGQSIFCLRLWEFVCVRMEKRALLGS